MDEFMFVYFSSSLLNTGDNFLTQKPRRDQRFHQSEFINLIPARIYTMMWNIRIIFFLPSLVILNVWCSFKSLLVKVTSTVSGLHVSRSKLVKRLEEHEQGRSAASVWVTSRWQNWPNWNFVPAVSTKGGERGFSRSASNVYATDLFQGKQIYFDVTMQKMIFKGFQ